MPLETGDFIPELDPNNPLGADNVSIGDDHMRLIKRAVTGSFPAFVGTTGTPKSVSLTEDQINDAALKSATAVISGAWQWDANLRLNNAVFLVGRNAADTQSLAIANIGATDVLTLGQDTQLASIDIRALADTRFFHNAIQSARIVDRASGSLLASDAGGAFSAVVRASGAQDIAATWSILTQLILKNNISLSGRNAADSGGGALIKLNASDILQIGDGSFPQLTNFFTEWFVRTGGVDVARFAPRAQGSLEVSDAAGVFGPVARTAGASQTINNVHSHTVTLQLKNNISLQGEDLGATPRNIARVNSTDIVTFGNAALEARIEGLSEVAFRQNSLEEAKLVERAIGSFLVKDTSGFFRKAGFRNPRRILDVASRALSQDDEGAVVRTNADNVIYTANALEAETAITINAPLQTGTQIIAGTAGLRVLDGSGATNNPATVNIALGSVVQLWWDSTAVVHIWGNGITF